MTYEKFSVRYVSDGKITRINFKMLPGASLFSIFEKATSQLFVHHRNSVGGTFCIYRDDDAEKPVNLNFVVMNYENSYLLWYEGVHYDIYDFMSWGLLPKKT